MGCEADQWAKEWLAKMRAEGSKGLTVQKIKGHHYVYWATTEWDSKLKKRHKVSEYIGVLDPPGNLIVSSDIDIENMDKRAIDAARIDVLRYKKREPEIVDYRIRGAMLVLNKFCKDFYISLKDCFPVVCDDLLMLAMARLAGRGRLCQAGKWFKTQDNIMSLNVHYDPESLSLALKIAGGSIDAQDKFFESLRTPGKRMAADMTVCFSKGKAYLIKKGYNRFRLSCGQFNMAIICGLDDKLPQSLKTVAGNVTESSIIDTLKEMGIGRDCMLVMDRGYFNEELMNELHARGYRFVIPVRRNSELYDSVKIDEVKGFRFRGDSVLCGMGEGFGFNAYRFENQRQRNSELSEMMNDGTRNRDEVDDWYALDGDPSKAGNLILVSNLNEEPDIVYTMFKLRCSVEEWNDTAKNAMEADSTYLRDNYSMMGYNFVTFLALRIYMSIEAWIASKEMTSKYTPTDVLFEYSSLVSVTTTERVVTQQIPANVRRIEEDLELGLV